MVDALRLRTLVLHPPPPNQNHRHFAHRLVAPLSGAVPDEDGAEADHPGVAIRIYKSSLATQEAVWFYVNESSLHLDITGCYLLGEGILSFASGRDIDRGGVEETLDELIDLYFDASDDE